LREFAASRGKFVHPAVSRDPHHHVMPAAGEASTEVIEKDLTASAGAGPAADQEDFQNLEAPADASRHLCQITASGECWRSLTRRGFPASSWASCRLSNTFTQASAPTAGLSEAAFSRDLSPQM